MVENKQWQQVLLEEVPAAEGLADERLALPVELYLLEELFERLFAELALDVDVQPADLFDAADTLHVVKKLGLFLRFVFLSHALGLVWMIPTSSPIHVVIFCARVTDIVIVLIDLIGMALMGLVLLDFLFIFVVESGRVHELPCVVSCLHT